MRISMHRSVVPVRGPDTGSAAGNDVPAALQIHGT